MNPLEKLVKSWDDKKRNGFNWLFGKKLGESRKNKNLLFVKTDLGTIFFTKSFLKRSEELVTFVTKSSKKGSTKRLGSIRYYYVDLLHKDVNYRIVIFATKSV